MGKGQYKAWPREDLSDASQRSMLREGGIVVMIGFAVVIGAFIGIVIDVADAAGRDPGQHQGIREPARTFGGIDGSLRLVVMELSLWVGVAGLLLTAVLTAAVWAIARSSGIPMDFPLFIDIPVATTLLIIAILSGALSLGVLGESQPAADLLRREFDCARRPGPQQGLQDRQDPAAGAQERQLHRLPRPGHHGDGAVGLRKVDADRCTVGVAPPGRG